MNICFCSQEYPPDTHAGGIGTYTYNMAGALAALGHTVHVITVAPDSDRDYLENGVFVHRVGYRKCRPLEISRLRYSRAVARKVKRLECRFDIVQASEYASEAFWLSHRKDCPLVTRLATPSFLLEKLNGCSFIARRPICNAMEKRQTLRSDGVFSSTLALARLVADEWGIARNRIEVIPNSIDLARICRLAGTGTLPENLSNTNYMLYFGRLEERKGVRVLADALREIFEQIGDITMVFAGADLGYQGLSMRDYIISKAGCHSSRIIFFDNLPHEKLLPIVNSARLVILPSLWEAFGFVCVEAMALGRPVIASSGSGFGEIIEHGVSGYLVEPGNSNRLAEKVLHCLRDMPGLCRVSEGAKVRAREFEVSRVAVRLVDYYQRTRSRWQRRQCGKSSETETLDMPGVGC